MSNEQVQDPLPCLFCGRPTALYGWHVTNLVTSYAVRCHNCGADGPRKENGPLAIAAWNRRATTVPAAASVPSAEVAQTIREALTTIKRAKSYELGFAESEEQWNEIRSDINKHSIKIDAALSWIDSLTREGNAK